MRAALMHLAHDLDEIAGVVDTVALVIFKRALDRHHLARKKILADGVLGPAKKKAPPKRG